MTALAGVVPHLTSQGWATLASVAGVLGGGATLVGMIFRAPVVGVLKSVLGVLAHLDPLRSLKRDVGTIKAQLQPNGGSSLSDKVNAIWERQGMTAAKMGMLLDESDALLWQSDLDGRQVWASRALVEITGRAPAELLGWGWTNVIHPDDRDRIRKCWIASLVEGRNFEEQCRFQTLHGTHYSGQLVAKPFLFDGKVIAWIGRATLDSPEIKTNGDHPVRRSAPKPRGR